MKRGSPVLNSSPVASSSSGSRSHKVSQSSKHKLANDQKGSQGTHSRTGRGPQKTARVLDADGNDVTPLPLCPVEPGDTPSKSSATLDDIFSGSQHSKSTLSSSRLFCSSTTDSSPLVSLSSKKTLTKETKGILPDLHINLNLPTPCKVPVEGNAEKEQATEETLDEVADIVLSETDTITLLDIPGVWVSEDADDAQRIKKQSAQYAELCKNKMGNEEYVNRSAQTLGGASKTKEIQTTTSIVMDKVSTGSAIGARLEIKTSGSALEDGPDLEEIMLSESFKNSLSVMERNVLANIFQPKLAAYRQLSILKDPDSEVEPGIEEQCEEDEESSFTPTVERLWAFVSELTKGCDITSMTWNKKNPDILAVGYGDSGYQKPGFICCWSLKNPTWPERVFSCDSSVTSLDFSANDPVRLAVGMHDGSVAIYNTQIEDGRACIASSGDFAKEHMHPVQQVTWTKLGLTLSGEEREEVLFSVSADGRITKWQFCSGRLYHLDLMRQKKIQVDEKRIAGSKKTKDVLSAMNPDLCVNFHPTDSGIYLAGNWDGLIHKCSISFSDHFLETYTKHSGRVNDIEWSPFCPDLFLSCSSDFTIQLWTRHSFTPALSFTSIKSEVYTAQWSPNHCTVFAAMYRQQVEIWDLSSSIMHPTIVHHAAPGVKLTSLLFTTGSDCVLVGDSEGQVTVYKLKNLKSGAGDQVDLLDFIQSVTKQP
ncbi:dynein axonemal intermediate chain 4-like [Odontesthes bonariensis]